MSEFENDFGEDGDELEWLAVGGCIKITTQMAVGINVNPGPDERLMWFPKSQISGLNGKLLEDTPYGFHFAPGLTVQDIQIPGWLIRRTTGL